MSSHGIVVAGLAVNDHGLILMGRRGPECSRPGMWELPGGKREPGERNEFTAQREWLEELGVTINVLGYLATSPVFDLEARFSIKLYRVRIVEGIPQANGRDHDALEWVEHDHAVRRMACTPSFYSHYPAIRALVTRLRQENW